MEGGVDGGRWDWREVCMAGVNGRDMWHQRLGERAASETQHCLDGFLNVRCGCDV